MWGDITHPCLSLQGACPALLIQDIWTLLPSFRNKRLRANCLAACRKMLCATTQRRAVSCADGCAEAAEVSLSFALFQDPQTQPPPGFYCPVCWGIASREFLSPSYRCWKSPPLSRLALSAAGALPPACSWASFLFRANTGWPLLLACLQRGSQLIALLF